MMQIRRKSRIGEFINPAPHGQQDAVDCEAEHSQSCLASRLTTSPLASQVPAGVSLLHSKLLDKYLSKGYQA